ncbi:MAG: hypothetical protein LBK06_07400 [Planctomycetaceae bacterium]|nr:hypothetical protein [Planctomycetaceae bacterium]
MSGIFNTLPCGAWGVGGSFPAVALRYTAGYAHLAPSGAKIEKLVITL